MKAIKVGVDLGGPATGKRRDAMETHIHEVRNVPLFGVKFGGHLVFKGGFLPFHREFFAFSLLLAVFQLDNRDRVVLVDLNAR